MKIVDNYQMCSRSILESDTHISCKVNGFQQHKESFLLQNKELRFYGHRHSTGDAKLCKHNSPRLPTDGVNFG